MTLTDTFLNQVAGVLNSESMTVPSHIGFSSTAITIDPSDTTLSGEFGSRVAVTSDRTLNETTFSCIKTGATVGSSGERINAMGLFNAASSGDLHAEALVSSSLQTSDFDVELDWIVKLQRRA